MRNSISKLVHLLDDNMGRCPRCIKIAFVCALISWLAVLAAHFIWPAQEFRKLLSLVALGLTAVWLLHFAAYTARVLAALWDEYIGGAVPLRSHGEAMALAGATCFGFVAVR